MVTSCVPVFTPLKMGMGWCQGPLSSLISFPDSMILKPEGVLGPPSSKFPVSTGYMVGPPAIKGELWCVMWKRGLESVPRRGLCLWILPCASWPPSLQCPQTRMNAWGQQGYWPISLLKRFLLFQWYKNPDYRFFDKYKSYRKLHPDQPFYILRPQMPWQLWDVIQEISTEEIQPNPPSSGMLGESTSGERPFMFLSRRGYLSSGVSFIHSFIKQLLGLFTVSSYS